MADNVITALNDFNKMPMPDVRPLEVASCLKECLELNPLPPGIQVNLDFPDSLPPILGDEHQLKIVFGNLIRNARDAMSDGGNLTIKARQNGSHIEVSVSDTGMGIAPADLGRIMEPLFSTKSRGIGLGLPIVRAILEKHNGFLDVASELKQGTTMTVRLPAILGETAGLQSGTASK
jgi:two-component system sensor kinase FixL